MKKRSAGDVLAELQKARKNGSPVAIDLRGANLHGFHLPAADLVGATLRDVDLEGAVLAGANLTGADLRNANLLGTRLDGTNLTDADLRGADLAGASIDDAIFAGARLEGAALAAVLGDPLSMTGAKMDEKTIENSHFTRLDIAAMVARGAIIDGREEENAHSLPTAKLRDPSFLPQSAFEPSHFPAKEHDSLSPAARNKETITRIEIAESQEGSGVTISQRMLLDMNALIEAARAEGGSENASLVAQMPVIEKMTEKRFGFPEIGEVYLGVTINEELSPGTTSRCFRGRNSDGHSAVVRIFDPSCDGAALQLPAFQRGLRALNKLQSPSDGHEHVIELLAVAPDQTSFAAREVVGTNLTEMALGALPLDEALNTIADLCNAVEKIHQNGLMIRAWKPSNVLVDGRLLRIAELDMVHLRTLAQYRENLCGYRSFAAPEEIIGCGTRSPTADIYSLGKIFELLLTGEEPLASLGGQRLIENRESIPKFLVQIVLRATRQIPEERYSDAGALLDDIKAFRLHGDTAVMRTIMHPPAASRLPQLPLSRNPDLPQVRALIAARQERPPQNSQEALNSGRQVELTVGLLGGLGGLALAALLVLSPSTVDRMEGLQVVLAATMGLSVFLFGRAKMHPVLFRGGTYLGASCLIWLLNPLSLTQVTWQRRLHSGSLIQKEAAVVALSRLGERDLSGSQLDDGRFVGKNLSSVNFQGSSLRNVDLRNAFLLESDFHGADLTGAQLDGANLFNARLLSAHGLNEASCNRYTQLPVGLICKGGAITSTSSLSHEAKATIQRGEANIKEQTETTPQRTAVVVVPADTQAASDK